MCLPNAPRIMDPLQAHEKIGLSKNGIRQGSDPLRLTTMGGKYTDPMGLYKNNNPNVTRDSGARGYQDLSTSRGTGLQI